MKNNLRQKILNELKFLLNEQEEAEEGVLSGQFSEELDDILEDINDANIKNIAGFDYIDLTTMEDSTDEGELNLFVKSFKNVTKLSQLQDPDSQKAINKICSTNMLLINSFGPTDTYFYVSCKQTSDGYKLRVPVSAKKIGSQGQEATFPAIIEQIQQGSTPTPPSAGTSPVAPSGNDGSVKEKTMTFEEYKKYASNKENVKSKNVWYMDGTTKAYLIASHDANGNWVETKDESGKVVASAQGGGGSTGDGGLGKQLGASFKCTDDEAVKLWQGSLGVKADGNIGINTLTSAKKKNPTLFTANLKDYLEIGPDKKPTKEAQTRQLGLCNYLSKNKEDYRKNQKKIPAGGGKVAKTQNGTTNIPAGSMTLRTCSDGSTPLNGDMNKCPPLEESKNYYDNKKLNEAKQLFNKLLKSL